MRKLLVQMSRPPRTAVAHLACWVAPRITGDLLQQKYPAKFQRSIATSAPENWLQHRLPDPPLTRTPDLADLSGLFNVSLFNRGAVRLDFDEALVIAETVRSLLPGAKGLEIGRFRGGSTLLVACVLGADGHLTSIDINDAHDSTLQRAFKAFNLPDNTTLIAADANEVTPEAVAAPFDFIFIDGDHSYEGASKDHNRWGQHVRPGGCLLYHDMARARPNAAPLPALVRLRQQILDSGAFDLDREKGTVSVFVRNHRPWQAVG